MKPAPPAALCKSSLAYTSPNSPEATADSIIRSVELITLLDRQSSHPATTRSRPITQESVIEESGEREEPISLPPAPDAHQAPTRAAPQSTSIRAADWVCVVLIYSLYISPPDSVIFTLVI